MKIIEKHALFFRLIIAAVCLLAFSAVLLLPMGKAEGDSAYIRIMSYASGETVYTEYLSLAVEYGDPGMFPESTTWYIEIVLRRIASLPEGPDDYFPESGQRFGDYVYSNYGTYSTGNIGPEFSGVTYVLKPGQYEITATLSASTTGGYSKIATDRITIWYRPQASGSVIPPPSSTTPADGGTSAGAVVGIVAGIAAVVGGGIWLLRKMFVGKPAPVKPQPRVVYKEAETVEQAAARLAAVKRNGELMDRYHRLRQIVWNDDRLLDFVDNARNSIIGKDGQINEANLIRLENNLKYWIRRDTLGEKMPEYGGTDVMIDLLKAPVTGWTGMFVRAGAAFVTGGYSEMVFNPLSTMVTIRESINQDKSTIQAVYEGYKHSVTHLAVGEAGRLVKYAKPYFEAWQKSRARARFNEVHPDIAHELSNIEQLAKQGHTTRNAFMKNTEVVTTGKTATTNLSHAEKLAIELNNNPVARKVLAENSSIMSNEIKEVMGVAKQKVYENARNAAIDDVMKQMAKEGVKPEGPLFVQQTGTHARPGNPAWDSLKSDFDHTVDFGSAQRNAFYESRFNAHLEAQGASASAIDANVYGAGTSARGAYHGGAMKFVENYNQTTGSQVMIRAKDGITTISREEPQVIDSLLSKMKPEDVSSARVNYREFFKKSLDKGGSIDNILKNTSKEVSRTAKLDYVQNFHQTGKVSNFQPPPAVKVATLVKEKGLSVDAAMQKAGYNGSKEQLLAEYKKIVGL